MGAAASLFGAPTGGGTPISVSPSSSAASGPQAGQTGNLVLNFGGINLGNQDIPLNASSANSQSLPAVVGTVPNNSFSGAANILTSSMSYLPIALLAGAAIALYYWAKKR